MVDTRNRNPIVMWAKCVTCGGDVALFAKDADDYLANPVAGLQHFECMATTPDGRWKP